MMAGALSKEEGEEEGEVPASLPFCSRGHHVESALFEIQNSQTWREKEEVL